MNAVSVHGGGATPERISRRVGLRGREPLGIDMLCGLSGRNSFIDMMLSSSASQSDRADEQRGDDSLVDGLVRCRDGGRLALVRRIVLGGLI